MLAGLPVTAQDLVVLLLLLLFIRCRTGVLPCRILAPGSELPLGRSWSCEALGGVQYKGLAR